MARKKSSVVQHCEKVDEGSQSFNWKPWQLSRPLLLSLTITVGLLAVTLEVLVQLGNKTASAEYMLSSWLDWHAQENSGQRPDVVHDEPFRNASSLRAGLLTFDTISSVPAFYQFLWIYFPSILAVSMAVVWETVDVEVKRVEPFYQASRPQGAKAGRSIFAEYISIPPFLSPVQALRWQHWAVFWSSLSWVLVGFVTPILQSQLLQTETRLLQVGYVSTDLLGGDEWIRLDEDHFFLPFTNDTRLGAPNEAAQWIIGVSWDRGSPHFSFIPITTDVYELQTEGVLQTIVYVDPVLSRIQEAVLLAVLVSGSLLIWCLHRRKSGMGSSYEGLAATASLGSAYQDFLPCFSELSLQRVGDDSELRLASKTVHLGFRSVGDQSSYGFWFSEGDDAANSFNSPRPQPFRLMLAYSRRLIQQYWGTSGVLAGINRVCTLCIGAGGIIMFISLFTIGFPSSDPRGMDDASLPYQGNDVRTAAMVLTSIAVFKSLWKVFERKLLAFWFLTTLRRSPQKAWPLLTREYQSLPPFVASSRAFHDRQILIGFVSTLSLLLEVAHMAFGIAASMAQVPGIIANRAIAYSVIMITLLFFLFFPWVTNGKAAAPLPRLELDTSTLGYRFAYICHSQDLLRDMRPLTSLDATSRKTYLTQLETSYSLGQVNMRSTSDSRQSSASAYGIESHSQMVGDQE